jgi:hypothetical protein
VLCELARTDNHRFRVLEPDSDQTRALRALTRAREDLVHTRTSVVNQLRAELDRCWPGPLRLFSHMDSEILLAFLERYPSPVDARGLGIVRMQAFLKRERYSGRQKPEALLAKLRSAPEGRVGELELTARRQLVLTYVAMVRTLNGQVKGLELDIRTAVRAHPDGPLFLSLFKQAHSVIPAAELLAEIGDAALAIPTGTRSPLTPVNQRSRKSQANARPPSSAGGATSDSVSRSRGSLTAPVTGIPGRKLSTPRHETAALNTLARSARFGRAWCRIVWQCWQSRTAYDPTRHRSLQRHITVTIPSPSGPITDLAATARMTADLNPAPGALEPSAQHLTTGLHPVIHTRVDVMKGRAGPGDPDGERPGGRRSALRPESQG